MTKILLKQLPQKEKMFSRNIILVPPKKKRSTLTLIRRARYNQRSTTNLPKTALIEEKKNYQAPPNPKFFVRAQTSSAIQCIYSQSHSCFNCCVLPKTLFARGFAYFPFLIIFPLPCFCFCFVCLLQASTCFNVNNKIQFVRLM